MAAGPVLALAGLAALAFAAFGSSDKKEEKGSGGSKAPPIGQGGTPGLDATLSPYWRDVVTLHLARDTDPIQLDALADVVDGLAAPRAALFLRTKRDKIRDALAKGESVPGWQPGAQPPRKDPAYMQPPMPEPNTPPQPGPPQPGPPQPGPPQPGPPQPGPPPPPGPPVPAPPGPPGAGLVSPESIGLPVGGWIAANGASGNLRHTLQLDDYGMKVVTKWKQPSGQIKALMAKNPGRNWNAMPAGTVLEIPDEWWSGPRPQTTPAKLTGSAGAGGGGTALGQGPPGSGLPKTPPGFKPPPGTGTETPAPEPPGLIDPPWWEKMIPGTGLGTPDAGSYERAQAGLTQMGFGGGGDAASAAASTGGDHGATAAED